MEVHQTKQVLNITGKKKSNRKTLKNNRINKYIKFIYIFFLNTENLILWEKKKNI